MTRSMRLSLAAVIAVATVAVGIAVVSGDEAPGSRAGLDTGHAQPKPRAAKARRAGSPDRHRNQRSRPRPEIRAAEVPDLVGLKTRRAVRRLDPIGLEAKVEGQCEGIRPSGRVVHQARLGLDRSVVALWTDNKGLCSQRSTPRTCRASDLKLAPAAFPTYFGSGLVVGRSIGFGIRNVASKPCQLRTGAEVSVFRDGGSQPDDRILGNPTSLVFDWMLKPGDHVSGITSWQNWCGSREDATVRVRVRLGGWRDQIRAKPPPCDHRNRHSVMY